MICVLELLTRIADMLLLHFYVLQRGILTTLRTRITVRGRGMFRGTRAGSGNDYCVLYETLTANARRSRLPAGRPRLRDACRG